MGRHKPCPVGVKLAATAPLPCRARTRVAEGIAFGYPVRFPIARPLILDAYWAGTRPAPMGRHKACPYLIPQCHATVPSIARR
jgi:hypothetical protein